MFKRRKKRTVMESLGDTVYPRGGWARAAYYVVHRLRRLPDTPHKIARGVACGVFVCFTPFFGFHFVLAAAFAWMINGNILAAILATFVGNPLTFPFIITVSIELGAWMLSLPGGMPLKRITDAFANAFGELWSNLLAIFTPETVDWYRMGEFFHTMFMPFLVGGILPGLLTALIFYFLTTPVIEAYQKRRRKKLRKRFEKMQTDGNGAADSKKP